MMCTHTNQLNDSLEGAGALHQKNITFSQPEYIAAKGSNEDVAKTWIEQIPYAKTIVFNITIVYNIIISQFFLLFIIAKIMSLYTLIL